ncbi:hypothetical protein [Pseudoalteromonas sp. OOF1S-7]|uniref:hypothetical protein n=1 Tax=Pseudoalteromonas sp. OOF1S-7 TaxID=2917757 RepID=UPI001EF57860|nr:hypothetical protein [Pseudoalteromonas sp. OOF1S-7]MCG7537131.1 hypothetical protein [Pseudoalteromonas sp. OOF1S-7]
MFPDLSLIYFPSERANAYLQVLAELKINLSCIIVMKNSFKKEASRCVTEQNISEGARTLFTLEQYLRAFNSDVIECTAEDINNDEVFRILADRPEKNWLFCGGGILGKRMFTLGKKYIHIHPGELPAFRGSTCFYYSLLHDNSLAASAFFLEPSLDSGAPLKVCKFKVNRPAQILSTNYMDYVLDPWIRSETLKALLLEGVNATPQSSGTVVDTRSYYVIHPILRALTINKLAEQYQPDLGQGIFKIEQE